MNTFPIRLGVNIDHVATVREARGTAYPSVVDAGRICEESGADGITIHLREDRRHIQDADVYALRESLSVKINLEMANSAEIVGIALEVLPGEVCLVPEKREELTTEGGLDVAGQIEQLKPTVEKLMSKGIDVSLFIDPDPAQIIASAVLEVPYVELHTGRFCDADDSSAQHELELLVLAAKQCEALGIKVNAGHGINMSNIAGILDMPFLDTLNIGHSIIASAVMIGLPSAVKEMKDAISVYTGGVQ